MSSLRVNTVVLAEKLQALNTTQQVIESVSQWCIFYRRDARTIVQHWDLEFRRSTPEKKLSLLYLTNDILQNSRKKGREFAEEFVQVVPKALKTLWAEGNQKINRAVLRLVGVWEERRVFPGKSFRWCLTKPEELGGAKRKGTGTSTQPSELKYKAVEVLAEAIEECRVSSVNITEMEQKASIREGLLEQGTIAELRECEESLDRFHDELVADSERRRRVIEILQDMQAKQDDEIENCQELIMMCEIRKERIANRILDLEPLGSPMPPQMDALEEHNLSMDAETTMVELECALLLNQPELPSSSALPDPGEPPFQELSAEELNDLMVGVPDDLPTVSAPETSVGVEEPMGMINGNMTVDMVVKGLTESEQPAALLAQALQELPEEDREQIGSNLADFLNQPYDESDVPPQI